MIKYYTSLLFLLSNLFASHSILAQLAANNDVGAIPYQTSSVMIIPNILANDTLDGQPVSLSEVIISQVNTDTPSVSVETNGSVWWTPTGMDSPGIYTLVYRICRVDNPNDCTTALVTLNIDGCLAATPELSDIVPYICESRGSITVTANPQGFPWHIDVYRDGLIVSTLGEDLGPTTLIVDELIPARYDFVLHDNFCVSLPAHVQLAGIDCLSLAGEGTYTDFNNDGVTDVGDTINYQFVITNNSDMTFLGVGIYACCGDTSIAFSGDQVTPFPPGSIDSTTFTGIHILTQEDINAGYVYEEALAYGTYSIIFYEGGAHFTTSLNIPDRIRLNAFVDSNGNGVQDNGERNFTHGNFRYEINHDGIVHHVMSSSAYDLYETNPANLYGLNLDIDSEFAAQYTTTAAYTDVFAAIGSNVATYNFPVTELPFSDVAVHLYHSGAGPRPGFDYANTVEIANVGNQPVSSGMINFTKTPEAALVSVSPNGSVLTPGGFTFAFANLLPDERRFLSVLLHTAPIPQTAINDILTNTAVITGVNDDVHPNDNMASLSQIIFGSYDPNDKTESHGEKILFSGFTNDDYLIYTIQFENTGTANAINVRVIDTLDAKLDETSVRMIDCSAGYTLDRVGSSLLWRFDAINLPPSVEGSQTGKGHIVFKVKPRPGFEIGDIIPNTADIYFDSNPAITTNVCTTEFVSTLAVNGFATNDFAAYPNPVANILNISAGHRMIIEDVVITDVSGKTVLSKKVNHSEAAIDVSQLSNGVYFATLRSDGSQKTIKVIKE